MEKIKVNMTPIEEVKTIHASQNDNATRKWSFDLYDENGKIDSSDIKEQMIFDSRVGGTEQILPENTSDPTTSPIIADIQYPDSLRSEQTFLYRESPTSENGQAKITHIKGNTVVFNQLVQNGDFADTSVWGYGGGTFAVANNELTFTVSSGSANFRQVGNYVANHKYYVCFEMKSSIALSDMRYRLYSNNGNIISSSNAVSSSYKKYVGILTTPSAFGGGGERLYIYFDWNDQTPIGTVINVKNVMVIDLTQMFGSGNEPTSVDQFTSLYPLPYYDYTTGKLLPFLGESLKTTSKNLYNIQNTYVTNATTTLSIVDDELTIVGNVRPTARLQLPNYIAKGFLGRTFILSWNLVSLALTTPNLFCGFIIKKADGTNRYVSNGSKVLGENSIGITLNVGEEITSIDFNGNDSGNDYGTQTMVLKNIQLEFGSSASSYEPYTSSTINLPTLNYFPSGMKSAGSVYDEITENKAITRIGSVDMGTLNYGGSQSGGYYTSGLIGIIKGTSAYHNQIKCARYISVDKSSLSTMNNGEIAVDNSGYVQLKDSSYATQSDLKNSLNGLILYFELATPTEESITTASLVTEKGETPLYYDDELIADCNETISSESGIFDAKIKLMDDETVYSQKIQLQVERKPQ